MNFNIRYLYSQIQKKIVRQITLVVLTLLFASCDRFAKIHVQVINSLSKPINIKYIDNLHLNDTLHTVVVNSGDTIVVIRTISGILGRDEIPDDVCLKTDTFAMFQKFQISLDNIVFKKDFRLSKEWTYIGVDKNLGIYRLEIDSTNND